ncbi:hypothetical protein [uncultured Tateyamaria sp.]|uniref:hypothetical protein n=1 Tax=uncultured Tateyamaria sp. TaxID=455651 RepID=UPI0026248C51|nr:hypothetical protein [uncultured Tateyamaria sp.]
MLLCAETAQGVFDAGQVIFLPFAPKLLETPGQFAVAAAGAISIDSWIMIVSGDACGQIMDRFGRRTLFFLSASAGLSPLLLIGQPGTGLGASVLCIGLSDGTQAYPRVGNGSGPS